ncbi:Bro-N domain-containing protein [Azotobacter sp. CWF10]
MSQELQLFNFKKTQVRVVSIDGEPWFVAKDLSDALGYAWNGTARISHVPAEWRGSHPL